MSITQQDINTIRTNYSLFNGLQITPFDGYFGDPDGTDTNANLSFSSLSRGPGPAPARTSEQTTALLTYIGYSSGVSTSISFALTTEEYYSLKISGYFLPKKTANYRFTTNSDDASYLWIGTEYQTIDDLESTRTIESATVDNGDLHGRTPVTSSSVPLEAGKLYPILIYYGEYGGGDELEVSFTTSGAAYSDPASTNQDDVDTNFTIEGLNYFFNPNGINNVLVENSNDEPDDSNLNETWSQLHDQNEGVAGEYLGSSISMSGDGTVIAVSSIRDNLTSGEVKIFNLDDGNLSYVPELDLTADSATEYFGRSISLNENGTILVVGAPSDNSDTGRVGVYQYDPNDPSWVQLGTSLLGDNTNDKFGNSVSINSDGTRIAIKSLTYAKMFEYIEDDSGASWVQMGSNILSSTFQDSATRCIAINDNGTIVAIGEGENNLIKVYQYNGSSWIQKGSDINGIVDDSGENYFGFSVSINANGTVVAGGSNDITGSVSVYYFINLDWSQLGNTIDGSNIGDNAGYSISLNSVGDVIAVGSPGAITSDGFVRVYQYTDGQWEQLGNTIYGNQDSSYGYSLSLANDSSYVTATGPFYATGQLPLGYFDVTEYGGIIGNNFAGNMFGDPHIVPILNAKPYLLPHDEKTYLLFDNNCMDDRLIVKGKLFYPRDSFLIKRKKYAYIKYIKFEYNKNSFIIDIETLTLKDYCNDNFNKNKLADCDNQNPSYKNITIKKNNKLNFKIYSQNIQSNTSIGKEIMFKTKIGNVKFNLIADSLGRPNLKFNVQIILSKLNRSYSGALIKKEIIETEF